MAKSTSVAGILAIGAVIAGGAAIGGVSLVATPAGAATMSATMSAQHGLVRFGHPHARGQRNRQKNGQRHNQRLREQQRQHQFLMRDLTLVLVPYQKDSTDARALPYNWQNDSVVAQQYGNQDRLSTQENAPDAAEINLDGEEHDNKTTVSPRVQKHEVEVDRSGDVDKTDGPVPSYADPGGRQGDVVGSVPAVPPATAPEPQLNAEPDAQPDAQPAAQPVVEPVADPAPASAPAACASARTPALTLPLTLSLTATVSLDATPEAATPEAATTATTGSTESTGACPRSTP
ncbi:hypothetical protein AAH991_01395 [Microbispora sp. ZYX-F-249]|uniref:Uncharacterized protein n=1 Tax=Microbispora maris TaxID=3144104 RepID=A0ABV0AEG2_9ACTN